MPKLVKRPVKKIAPKTLKKMKERNQEKKINDWLKTPKAKKFIAEMEAESNKTKKMIEEAKKPLYPVYKKK